MIGPQRRAREKAHRLASSNSISKDVMALLRNRWEIGKLPRTIKGVVTSFPMPVLRENRERLMAVGVRTSIEKDLTWERA